MSGSTIARIHLELGSERELVQLARLVISGVASASAMGLDEAEDCRAAIDELSSSLLELATPNSLLVIDITSDGTRIEATGEVAVARDLVPDETRRQISEMILDAVTDHHELAIDADAGRATFRFVRSARGSPDEGEHVVVEEDEAEEGGAP